MNNYFMIKQKSAKQIIVIILCVAVMGAAMQFLASYILSAILDLIPDVAERYMSNMSSILEITPKMLFRVCILFPVVEELFFRGLIFSLMSKMLPFVFANIIQAVVFGIYHGNIVQGVYAFILGMFIGYLLYITGCIVYTMIFHIAINFTGMFLDQIVPTDASTMLKTIIAVISLIVIILLTKCILKVTENTNL